MSTASVKAQPPAWLAWVLVVAAAGLTLHACWRGEGRPRHLVQQAATRLQKVPPTPRFQAVEAVMHRASQGRNLYLCFRWPPEAHAAMHDLASMYWLRGTYVLWPQRLLVAPIEMPAGGLDILPVNAPLPDAYWFMQAQVASIMELTWDNGLPIYRRLPLPAPGARPLEAP